MAAALLSGLLLIGLGVLSEGSALLTLGLVRGWGEIVPRWVPWFGGRRLAPAVVIVPATLGGVAATVLGLTLALTFPGNIESVNGWVVLMIVSSGQFIAVTKPPHKLRRTSAAPS